MSQLNGMFGENVKKVSEELHPRRVTKWIHYTKLRPNGEQYRDETKSREREEALADLIESDGQVLQDLLVRKTDADEYEIISGHTRYGACRILTEERKKDGISLEATGTGGNVTYEDDLAPYTILIHKVSDADKPLEGAEFALYADKDLKKLISKGVTDKGGTLRFEALTVGTTYFLTETKAPTGYRMPLDEDGKPPVTEIKVTSDPEKDLFDLYIDGEKRDFKDGYELTGTKAERQVDITVTNEHGAPLPDTGSSLTLTIIVAAVVLTAVVLLTRKKHRKDSGKDDTNDVK